MNIRERSFKLLVHTYLPRNDLRRFNGVLKKNRGVDSSLRHELKCAQLRQLKHEH